MINSHSSICPQQGDNNNLLPFIEKDSLFFSLAGLILSVVSENNPIFNRSLPDADKKFIASHDEMGHVDINIAPCREEHLCRDFTRKIFTQQRMAFCRTEDGYVQLFFSTEDTLAPSCGISVDFNFSKFNYYIHDDAKEEFDPCKLASNIFLLQHSFINHQGLIIHAAGGSIYGKGIAFAAPSQTGKSTLSRLFLLSPQNRLFSEDRLIIRSVNTTWQVWGTPWLGSGTIACNEHAPLSALVFLSQANETKVTRLSPSVGLRRLLQVVSIPWYSPEWTHKGLAVCESLIQTIPMFELAFRPDQTAVQAVERLASALC
ncbi:hypothetical protein [Candidatus Electronema sp. PJ]|uniref:hypothetical protein n=1 Tax=Candidatus Electronema sp. PJ TaxID=3401572 RepID=UPI003AA9C731